MLTVLLAVLVVVLAVALLDRISAATAERRSGEYLQGVFGSRPLVQVHGAPFLSQALRGRYTSVTFDVGGLRVGPMTGATLTARIRNAYLPLGALMGRRPPEMPCEHVAGEVLLPYGELARVTRIPYLSLDYDNGRLIGSAALPIPGVSALTRISGEAVLTIVGGGAMWLRLGGVSVAGISVPRLVLDQVLGSLSVPVPIPDLPTGVRLSEVRPTPDGLLIGGEGSAVTFRRPPTSSPAAPAAGTGDDRPRRAG